MNAGKPLLSIMLQSNKINEIPDYQPFKNK